MDDAQTVNEASRNANVEPDAAVGNANPRHMARASLMGRHSHSTRNGAVAHVWTRQGKYLARGSYEGHRFGETLGSDPIEAECRLRELLVEIDNGSYLRPSDSRNRPLARGAVPRLTIRELVDRKLVETRRLRGKNTADDYRARFDRLIQYSETNKVRPNYPLAAAVDRTFVVEFKAWLFHQHTTRNGHAAAAIKALSSRQIHNILSACATLFNWGRRSDVNLLPADFVNPFSRELIGERPMRDPLEKPKLPLDVRIQLASAMDVWELCTLCWSLVLPQRPEEIAGLLISDVNIDRREIIFATRLGGDDFNKARASFRSVYPAQFDSIVRACMGGRGAGPLLRQRKFFEGLTTPRIVVTTDSEIGLRYQNMLADAGDEVTAAQDRKRVFRHLLRKLGGVSEDQMAAAFQRKLRVIRPDIDTSFYALRRAKSTEMADAGVDYLTRKYVMGRSLGGETQAIYEFQNLELQMGRYFRHIEPLLSAIARRAETLDVGVRANKETVQTLRGPIVSERR
jgi:hypothetical protein